MHIRIQSAIQGFRRAGVAHSTKPTYYVEGYFSAAQMAQLQAEPRLAISLVETLPEGETAKGDPAPGRLDEHGSSDLVAGVLAGVAGAGDKVTLLDDMKVAELRDIAKDMNIDGYASMKKADLVKAIQAEKVLVDEAEAGAETAAEGADPDADESDQEEAPDADADQSTEA